MRVERDAVSRSDLLRDRAEGIDAPIGELRPSAIGSVIIGVADHRLQGGSVHDAHAFSRVASA
jgi:hypothetical protein